MPPGARAAVLSVSPVPAARPVAVGQATGLSVTWTVVRGEASCNSTVTSSAGLLRANSPAGPLVLGVPTALSQTRACDPDIGTSTFVFTETVLIPADAVQRAHRLGATNLVYVRSFTDLSSWGNNGISVATGAVNLPIVGAAAAGLSVSRQALYFDDRSPMRVIGRGEGLQALAEIAFSGSGLLQATWELAGPTSTAGEPVYRPLATVREHLAVGERKTLKSPPLPTDSTGLYQLRLRITEPATTFESPVIRYFVGEGRPGQGLPPQPLAAFAPAPRALFSADTAFAWEPLADARAYRLELYLLPRSASAALPDLGGEASGLPSTMVADALARAPVTGMLVPGQQTRVTLSGLARLRLEPGRGYLWRVLAIGPNGAVIGATAVRELRTP